jgi:hypothetical protein
MTSRNETQAEIFPNCYRIQTAFIGIRDAVPAEEKAPQ